MKDGTVASDRYTPQQLADMARRLEECIEVSALCMELALAGDRHRQMLGHAGADGTEGVGREGSARDRGSLQTSVAGLRAPNRRES